MSDLPPEVIEEILSRVPATSLKRLRSTCNRWNVLFKDQRFTKKHHDRAAKQFLVLMLHKKNFISVSFNQHEIDDNIAAPIIEFKGELSLTQNIKQVVFHCDGLFLCTTKNDRLVVWNPCTGETKFIIPCNRYYKYSMFAMGYEDNKSFRNYKLLRYRSNHDPKDPVVEFEIYEFSSGTWRVLELTANFLIESHGVSLKGNTYWLAFGNYLLCFDFSTERLIDLCIPFKDYCCDIAVLSVVREEKLSVLYQRFDTLEIEIWVATTDKIDETVFLSWTRFLAIDIYKLSGYLQFSSLESFFMDEEKKLVVCCCDSRCRDGNTSNIKNMVQVIGEYGVYREIQFGESIHNSGHARFFNYVPSLVQNQESTLMPRSGKRKERNISIEA